MKFFLNLSANHDIYRFRADKKVSELVKFTNLKSVKVKGTTITARSFEDAVEVSYIILENMPREKQRQEHRLAITDDADPYAYALINNYKLAQFSKATYLRDTIDEDMLYPNRFISELGYSLVEDLVESAIALSRGNKRELFSSTLRDIENITDAGYGRGKSDKDFIETLRDFIERQQKAFGGYVILYYEITGKNLF